MKIETAAHRILFANPETLLAWKIAGQFHTPGQQTDCFLPDAQLFGPGFPYYTKV